MAFLLSIPLAAGALSGCAGGNRTEEGGERTEEGGGAVTGPVAQSTAADSADITFTDLGETNITDAYAVNGLDKEIDYLLKLDADRLLAGFYENSSLKTNGAVRYGGGWEDALIGGHTMGHYLTALSQAIVNAGTPAEDKANLKTKLDGIVSELKACQDAYDASRGAKEGFLWAAKIADASNVEFQFDNVENGNAGDIQTKAWVPWYTMHKIIAGLIDAYTLTGNETALSVVKKLGDWVCARTDTWSETTQSIVLSVEYGGMNDCMYNLYRVTGEEKYAVAAHKFDEESLFTLLYNGTPNCLNNRHANTTIPKIIGALNGYICTNGKTIAGELADREWYLAVAQIFWEVVVEHHTYVTGGNSEWEHFGADDVLDAERTYANCETCNTYNMLKLSRTLFTLTKDTRYLDFYENTYFNAIWSSQNPETGMTTYFQPMASGYFKVYSSEENHFWCCTGSGMESFTKLGDSIYFDAGNATYVSLYLSSVYRTDAVTLTQSADLENSDTVTIKVDSGATVLRLRKPDWTAKFEVSVNGNAVTGEAKNGLLSVDVKAGDEVRIELEKRVTAHNLPDGQDTYAFKYGPYVLSAQMGSENMVQTTTGVNVSVPESSIGGQRYGVEAESVQSFMENINSTMVRGADGTFTLACTNATLTYSVHFRQYTQRYGIYFRFTTDEVTEGNLTNRWRRTDTVQPGYGQYEVDELHAMTQENSVAVTDDGTYRYAKEGGSFSYRMAVKKGVRNRLLIHLRKEDNGQTLRICVGSTVLFSETLAYTGTESEYLQEVMIPVSLADSAVQISANGRTYDVLTFTFSGADGAQSARVCSYIYSEALSNNLAYFVDCGDFDPQTLTGDDMLGIYNSVTEQVYGKDAGTGMTWGIYDPCATDLAAAKGHYPEEGKGICTNSTWAYEYASGDGVAKTLSNRYTKDQFESGVARNLHYKFELPDGTYTVKMYFNDPWNVSNAPNVAAEGQSVLTACAVDTEVSFTVKVSDGVLDLDITSDASCINICYIVIEFAD